MSLRKLTVLSYLQTKALFDVIDANGDGHVTRDEFVAGMLAAPHVDATEVEAGRMFDKLDTEKAGMIFSSQFMEVRVFATGLVHCITLQFNDVV